MHNNRIIDDRDVYLYSMPMLEDDSIQKNKHDIKHDIEEMQRKAYEEGFASGEKAGFADGEQKALILIDRLEKIVEGMAVFKDNFVKNLEGQVVDLAIAMAQKILHEEISARPEVIVTVVKEALKKLQRTGVITIRINPALYDLFMKKKSELTEIHEEILFDVNSNVSLTGPLVISQTEEVVTDIDAMIARIVEDINNVREQKLKRSSQDSVSDVTTDEEVK